MIDSLAGANCPGAGLIKRWLACAAILLLAGGSTLQARAPAGPLHSAPERIVSLNLCTDQLLMQMAAPERIAAISYLARDPRTSAMAEEARHLPVTSGVAEEVIALRPDLVLAGTFSTRPTVSILRRLGYRVIEFEPETDFAAIRHNIRRMAAALDEHARGEAMVAAIDQRLAALPNPPRQRPVYADYDANGFTSGGNTLLAALAGAAGFDMLGERLGFAAPRHIPLEQMLAAEPDLIDPGEGHSGPALASEVVRHPALQRLMRQQEVVDVPSAYTTCGNLRSLRALDRLLQARRAI